MGRKLFENKKTRQWWVEMNSQGWKEAAKELGFPTKSEYGIWYASGPWTEAQAREVLSLVAARADQVKTWTNRGGEPPSIQDFLSVHPKAHTARTT